jgi:hypothetical protein
MKLFDLAFFLDPIRMDSDLWLFRYDPESERIERILESQDYLRSYESAHPHLSEKLDPDQHLNEAGPQP